MKIATWNVNGIRKRRDEVLAWIDREHPDVVCLQEIKALPDQIPSELASLEAYRSAWHGHKGYSGVALMLLRDRFPDEVAFEHPPFDYETRIVSATVGRDVFASVYVPNGGKDFAAKMTFLHAMERWARELREAGKGLVLCGDFNVARTDIDVHPRERARVVGQLPVEREVLEKTLGHGLTDLLRAYHPEDPEVFSWWAPWRNMRERNIGWRLDYVAAGEAMRERAVSCRVSKDVGTSDHAPVVATFQD